MKGIDAKRDKSKKSKFSMNLSKDWPSGRSSYANMVSYGNHGKNYKW